MLLLNHWCCFYYFVRNSLVTLLEALCARICCLDSWISSFSDVFFWYIHINMTIGVYEYGRGGKCVQMFKYTFTHMNWRNEDADGRQREVFDQDYVYFNRHRDIGAYWYWKQLLWICSRTQYKNTNIRSGTHTMFGTWMYWNVEVYEYGKPGAAACKRVEIVWRHVCNQIVSTRLMT